MYPIHNNYTCINNNNNNNNNNNTNTNNVGTAIVIIKDNAVKMAIVMIVLQIVIIL